VAGGHGFRDKAVALLDRGAELMSLTGEWWCEAELTRLRARFSARDRDESAALLERALATARDQGAKLWQLRAATDLARLHRDVSGPDAAYATLGPVYAAFSEGFELPDLAAAKLLLEEIAPATG
jgi:predicted ATPase